MSRIYEGVERINLKELGKITLYVRKKEIKRENQLFTKNTGFCKFVRRSIKVDPCPMIKF